MSEMKKRTPTKRADESASAFRKGSDKSDAKHTPWMSFKALSSNNQGKTLVERIAPPASFMGDILLAIYDIAYTAIFLVGIGATGFYAEAVLPHVCSGVNANAKVSFLPPPAP